jgi:hypothetical protein
VPHSGRWAAGGDDDIDALIGQFLGVLIQCPTGFIARPLFFDLDVFLFDEIVQAGNECRVMFLKRAFGAVVKKSTLRAAMIVAA